MQKTLTIIQIILACLLMLSILLQQRGAGVSSLFGGAGGVYRTKRGIEKTLFFTTIILSILFISISLATVLLSV